MTTETTQPAQLTGMCRDQVSAVQALLDLIRQHDGLPAPYITVQQPMPEYQFFPRLDLQLDTPSHFEQWRSALEALASDVELHATTSSTWLQVATSFEGICVHLSGFNVPLTSVQAQAPRDRSAVTA
ncbi:hypothetical protein [Streptomyces luteogriseus]|uniref:hypothetical protein n=1 Tax=Streptomyces luteogriseus TaxID=68233 RepID=UPI00380CAA12